MMPKIKLNNGVEIPHLGLGTWQLKGQTCVDAVKIALEIGYTHIDTAQVYGNHKQIAEGIKGHDRKKLFITSKVPPQNLGYANVIKTVNKILDDLNTDYLDLCLIHWPNPFLSLKKTLPAFEKLYNEKKIMAFGISNFNTKKTKEALELSKIPIVTNQVEFHPLLHQKKLLEFCAENNIVITAYSPIARGHVFKNKTLLKIAKKYNKNPAQISIRWLLDKGIVVIPKASSREHLLENMGVFDFKLKKEDSKEIDNLKEQKRLVPLGF